MPIVDYEHTADKAQQKLLSNEKIPKKTKELLKKFLVAYRNKVSPARVCIFCSNIRHFAVLCHDIDSSLIDRDYVNLLFSEIKKTTTTAYYETIKALAITFVTWLNQGEKPKSFSDVKSNKEGQMRDLKPSDMTTWQDGLLIASKTNSVQLKAVVLTQLDAGLRPSEFIDLNYGDCERQGNYIVLNVPKHKTKERDVILYYCVPYLQEWLNCHPTKKPSDPLWMVEHASYSHRKEDIKKKYTANRRYKYPTLAKHVKTLAKKAGIQKPCDFYSLRHSAVVISKLNNVPLDLASDRFGHSAKYYQNTYGRLSSKDKLDRYRKVVGEELEEMQKDELPKNINCPFCKQINSPERRYCTNCSQPLSLQQAMHDTNRLNQMEKKLEMIYDCLKQDKEKELKARL